MARSLSDALVLFGVTGDLAHKMTFPALYAMVKHGTLNVPVIGVAFPKSEERPGQEAPYKRLLGDAMQRDGVLFTSVDAGETAWAVVDPVLKRHQLVRIYKHIAGAKRGRRDSRARRYLAQPGPAKALGEQR